MKKKVLCILVIMFIVGGCSNTKDANMGKEETFFSLFKNVDFNGDLRLEEDPSAPNNHLIGSEVDLILKNLSNREIEFSISDNLTIYRYDDEAKKWLKIYNRFSYHGLIQVLPPKGTPGISDAYALSWPNLVDHGSPIQIRIVAIGSYVDDYKHLIGDYYDVTLVPYEQ